MESPYLTTSDVAALLRMSAESVRRLERWGQLPAQRTGGTRGFRVFLRADVLAFRERSVRRPGRHHPIRIATGDAHL